MRKRGPLLGALMLVMLFPAAPALAHAERVGSVPKEGARLASPPTTLRIDFSEPPIGNAEFAVMDGCGRDVVTGIEVQNLEIEAALAAGQPGRWEVQTRVVSGVDGHATSDSWTFSVQGKTDCSEEPPPAADRPPGERDSQDRGGSFPLLPFAAATLMIIVLALVFRGRGAGR